MSPHTTNKLKDIGLLIARLGLGLTFIFVYGIPKLMGGPERWKGLGGAMKNLGITWYPELWGFLSMSAEVLGATLLILGLLFRPAAFIMAFNMFVAMMSHFANADPWMRVATPMQLMTVFFALMLIGPGVYSLDELIWRRRRQTGYRPLIKSKPVELR
jgi:putative oxidoreductase